MNTNRYSNVDNEIKSELMQYAISKYGSELEEVFYEPAIDATQNYVLCLKDKYGRVFNVYESAKTGKRTDDYKYCLFDYRMRDFLVEHLNINEVEASIGVMAVMILDVDIQTLEGLSLEECIDRFGLYSLIFVYHFKGNKGSIVDNGESIIEVYNKLCSIKTNTIDFNVVVTSGEESDVTDVLENMQYRYTGSWYSCSGVQEYISEANPELKTLDDLKALVKE